MKNFQRASLACSVSVIAALCIIAPASAANVETIDGLTIERVSETADINTLEMGIVSISAPATAKVSFDKPAVTSIAAPPPPAPVVEAPAPVAVQNVAVAAPQAANATQSAPARAAVPQKAVAPAPVRAAPAPVAPAPGPVSASGKGATIAAAAMAQLGVSQDCTRLASNALRAAGINFHSGPAGYKSLGTVVPASQAQAGDLIYYSNAGAGMPHIAVYVGGGKAVHGGWNGGTTSLQTAFLGSGQTFIRVA